MILVQYHNVCIQTLFLWCNKHVLWPKSTWSNLTHMFITGWSMFQKCHLCIFPNQFGVTPILDSPTKDKEISLGKYTLMAHWPFFCMVATDLADWKMAAMEGQPFELSLFGEVWGCHWKHAIFYIFAPCHQIRMRCSDHCSLCSCFFCLFSKCKDRQNEINSIKVTRNRQRREKLPVPAVIQLNSETLHPMWGLSGFVFFYLRCLCSAISM